MLVGIGGYRRPTEQIRAGKPPQVVPRWPTEECPGDSILKNALVNFRFLSRLIVACSLLFSMGLLANINMTPATTTCHYQPADVQPIWMKIDLNGDGKISRDELGEEDPRLLSKFDDADLDHDGTLSLRELEILLLSV
jgi:hypothetical protein